MVDIFQYNNIQRQLNSQKSSLDLQHHRFLFHSAIYRIKTFV